MEHEPGSPTLERAAESEEVQTESAGEDALPLKNEESKETQSTLLREIVDTLREAKVYIEAFYAKPGNNHPAVRIELDRTFDTYFQAFRRFEQQVAQMSPGLERDEIVLTLIPLERLVKRNMMSMDGATALTEMLSDPAKADELKAENLSTRDQGLEDARINAETERAIRLNEPGAAHLAEETHKKDFGE